MNELMIKKLNESDERRAKWSRMFGWSYFKKAKPYRFTVNDCIAWIDSNIAQTDRMLNHK